MKFPLTNQAEEPPSRLRKRTPATNVLVRARFGWRALYGAKPSQALWLVRVSGTKERQTETVRLLGDPLRCVCVATRCSRGSLDQTPSRAEPRVTLMLSATVDQS